MLYASESIITATVLTIPSRRQGVELMLVAVAFAIVVTGCMGAGRLRLPWPKHEMNGFWNLEWDRRRGRAIGLMGLR